MFVSCACVEVSQVCGSKQGDHRHASPISVIQEGVGGCLKGDVALHYVQWLTWQWGAFLSLVDRCSGRTMMATVSLYSCARNTVPSCFLHKRHQANQCTRESAVTGNKFNYSYNCSHDWSNCESFNQWSCDQEEPCVQYLRDTTCNDLPGIQ